MVHPTPSSPDTGAGPADAAVAPRCPDAIFGPGDSTVLDTSWADDRAAKAIHRYTYAAAAAMFAVPIPGVDIAATSAVYAKMTLEIGKAYGYELSSGDAGRLASHLLKSVVLTTLVWFGSAKIASTVLKFIPGAGTVTAYTLDAAIAAFGAKRVTAALGGSVALYFKSGRTEAPKTWREHVRNIARDPEMLNAVLRAFEPRPKK